jgi:hypothetical protein
VWALDDPSSTVYVEVFRAFKPFAAWKKSFKLKLYVIIATFEMAPLFCRMPST